MHNDAALQKTPERLALAETAALRCKQAFFFCFFASLILLGGRRKRMSQHPIPTSTTYTDVTAQDEPGLLPSLLPFARASDARGEREQERLSARLQTPANDAAAFRALAGEC